jgi:hypothetical protein
LANKISLSNGDTYFRGYFVYTTYTDRKPWQEVPGADGLITESSQQGSLNKEMTPEEMQARELYGYGLDVDTQVEGLDTHYYIVTADSLKNKMAEFGYGPLKLNSGMENDNSMPLNAAERVGRMLRLGDYLGYLQDKGLSEDNYSFSQYMTDLKNGEDRSYVVYYLKEKIIVDPTKAKELVFVYDMDFKNGFFNFKSGVYSQFGYIQTADGSLRIITVLTQALFDGNTVDMVTNHSKQDLADKAFPMQMLQTLKMNLIALSLSEIAQQGKPIDGDPYYVDNIYDQIKMTTPARKELVTLSQMPFAGANPDNPTLDINAFRVDMLK